MSAPWICAVVVLFLLLGIPVTIGILRDEKRKQWERDHAPAWWSNPVRPVMLGQSVTVAGQPSPVLIVEAKDPRIIRTSRVVGAKRGKPAKRTRIDRARQHVRKVQKQTRGVA